MGDFVTFEIAKKLKEKGFREECLYHYPNCGEDYAEANYIHGDDRFDINTDYLYQCNNNDSYLIDAPTISQVLKWLREERKIFILVEPEILAPEYKLTFTLRVKFYINGEEDEGFIEKYLTYRRDSYELAAIAGIEYVLENII